MNRFEMETSDSASSDAKSDAITGVRCSGSSVILITNEGGKRVLRTLGTGYKPRPKRLDSLEAVRRTSDAQIDAQMLRRTYDASRKIGKMFAPLSRKAANLATNHSSSPSGSQ